MNSSTFFRRIVTYFLATVILLIATGCTTLAEMPDGRFLGTTKVNDGIDRSTSYTAIYKATGAKKADGKPVLVEDQKLDVTTGPTVAGMSVVGAIGGIGVAAINNQTAKDVAKIGAAATCKGCGGTGTTQILVQGGQGGTANSLAASDARTNTAVNAAVGTCQSGGCATAVPLTVD